MRKLLIVALVVYAAFMSSVAAAWVAWDHYMSLEQAVLSPVIPYAPGWTHMDVWLDRNGVPNVAFYNSNTGEFRNVQHPDYLTFGRSGRPLPNQYQTPAVSPDVWNIIPGRQ